MTILLLPGKILLRLRHKGVYDPDVSFSAHSNHLPCGLVRDEGDVGPGLLILVEDNAVVVVDEARHRCENFVDFNNLKRPLQSLPFFSFEAKIGLSLIPDSV